jgi:hypothetical protein
MRRQPLREMDRRRLAVELVMATKLAHSHRQERGRDWCRQRCDDEHWPCAQRREADRRTEACVAELRRRDVTIEAARALWR